MTGRASALAVLGLEPGADAAAIERAYKHLLKQHHPDRGGDASRAAEITKAYRELRGGRAHVDPLQFNDYLENRRTRRRWPIAALFAVGGIAAAVMAVGPSVPLTRSLWAAKAEMPLHRAVPAALMHEPMNDQLHVPAIDEAVRKALHTYRTADEMALASASRECQRRFRDDPSTSLLDRCSAFDDAVVGLEDRDPLRDEGPFAPLAVTGRQWSAASTLSDDDLAIDDRLDQIRLRVSVTLTHELTPPVPAAAAAAD
ncbi:MAG: J domain-containing protein [Bacillota bacterium]